MKRVTYIISGFKHSPVREIYKDMEKIKWDKAGEWPDKWYNTEFCALLVGKMSNPISKNIYYQGLSMIALNTTWYFESKEHDRSNLEEQAVEKGNLPFLKKLVTGQEDYLKKARLLEKEIKAKDDLDIKVFGLIKRVFIYAWYIFLSDLGEAVDDYISKKLKNQGFSQEELEKVKSFYFQDRKSDLFKSQESLGKILKEKQINLKLAKKYYRRFNYLTAIDIDTQPATFEEFIKNLKEQTQASKDKPVITKLPPSFKNKLSPENKKYLELIHRHILADNIIADIYIRTEVWMLKKLSQKFEINFRDLTLYEVKELERLVKDGTRINNQEIEIRRKYRTLIQINGQIQTLYGQGKFEKVKKIVDQNRPNTMDRFTGRVAQPGKVVGMVKVIQGVKDVDKVKEGDILVATNTWPNLIMAMRRSGAIVTDWGGVTSHAAIVSREFKIPCVVGTKVATQVLKDGMKVEVDADNGVVNILK